MVELIHSTSLQRLQKIIETGGIMSGKAAGKNSIGAHPLMYSLDEFNEVVNAESIREQKKDKFNSEYMRIGDLTMKCSDELNKDILYKIRDTIRENWDEFNFTQKFSLVPPFKKESFAEQNLKAFLDSPEDFSIKYKESSGKKSEMLVSGVNDATDFIMGYYMSTEGAYESYEPNFSFSYPDKIQEMVKDEEIEVSALRIKQNSIPPNEVGPYLSPVENEWVSSGKKAVEDKQKPNMWVSIKINTEEDNLCPDLNKSNRGIDFQDDEPIWKQYLKQYKEIVHRGDVSTEQFVSVKFHSESIETLKSTYKTKEDIKVVAENCGVLFDEFMDIEEAICSIQRLDELMTIQKESIIETRIEKDTGLEL